MIRTEDRELYVSVMREWVDTLTSVRMVDAMEDALAVLLTETQANVNIDTGALHDDLNARIVDYVPSSHVVGGVSAMRDGVQKPYAWQVDRGGVIVPKASNPTQRLWWVDKSTGKLISARFVVQEGSFFMERSLENVQDQLVEKFKGAITGAFEVFE